jgi:hypothetical protein
MLCIANVAVQFFGNVLKGSKLAKWNIASAAEYGKPLLRRTSLFKEAQCGED